MLNNNIIFHASLTRCPKRTLYPANVNEIFSYSTAWFNARLLDRLFLNGKQTQISDIALKNYLLKMIYLNGQPETS